MFCHIFTSAFHKEAEKEKNKKQKHKNSESRNSIERKKENEQIRCDYNRCRSGRNFCGI
jgi:hypothetical protein